MQPTYVKSRDGTRLATYRTGDPSGPLVVFIHGFCQSHYSFVNQLQSDQLADCDMLAFDLRGHGLSEKPVDASSYQNAELWAADLQAVLGLAPGKQATVVAWSYAGYIVGDYLSCFGKSQLAALNLVGAAIKKNADVAHAVGPAFKTHVADLVSDDLLTTLRGVRKLTVDCTHRPMENGVRDLLERVACMTPHYVRRAMLSREVDNDRAWQDFAQPTVISHGRHDAVLLPAMADVTKAVLPAAEISWYDAGHSPFLEVPLRFNIELRRLVAAANS
jgi:pimeloyl-ACP methyl ester carboxylesterase